MHKYFIFDFDNTFVRCELTEVLTEIALKAHPDKKDLWIKAENLVKQGIKGKISAARLIIEGKLFSHCTHEDIQQVSQHLKKMITPSFLRNRDFFLRHCQRIFVITTNFRQIVYPVLQDFGMLEDHVFGNLLTFNKAGYVRGIDPHNPLVLPHGKASVLKQLKLHGEIIVIGDEAVDFTMKKQGGGTRFYAFTENKRSPDVIALADYEAKTLDDILINEGVHDPKKSS